MNNNNPSIHPVVIIGAGPAGLTAAVYAARANLKPLIIEGDLPGGQLMKTTYVENWPGEKSILGPELMGKMRKHAQHFGTEFVPESVVKVDFSTRPFKIWTNKNRELLAHSVIIATGTTPKRLGCPGENDYWGKGVTTCAVCDGAFYFDKEVIVIGGGDTAMEDASFLKKFTKKITVVHIFDKFTASHAMQQRVLNDPDIKIIYNSTVTEFKGDGNHLKSVLITDQKTSIQSEQPMDGAFIAIGLSPNTAYLQGHVAMNEWGFVTVSDQVKTSVEGVFAAGDVHDYKYRQAITSAGAGCMAALEAERYLAHLV